MNLGFKNPGIECLLTKWHHGMLSIMTARIITLETQIMARPLDDPLRHLGHNNNSNIYVEVIEYLNSAISVINLAQRNIKTRGKGFAGASDYLETWDDSDSITTINAPKRLETC